MNHDELVTVDQGADILGVTRNTIYLWRRRRLVTPAQITRDGAHLYVLAELRRIAATRRGNGRRQTSVVLF